MIGKLAKYVCVLLMVLGGVSMLTNSDFARYLSIASLAAGHVNETQPSVDDLRLSTELNDLDYRGLHAYRPLLKYSADEDIIEVLKAKRTLTLKLMDVTDPLVCALEYSGEANPLPHSFKQVKAENNAESLALFEMLADAKTRAVRDGVQGPFTDKDAGKTASTDDSKQRSPTHPNLYLPNNSAFETLMEIYSMEALSHIFAADPTDEQLCDSEVRLFDVILALPAPYGIPTRRYFVDLLYFAGT